ncbi:MAG TPA: hypothetical protein VGE43_17805, partial [Acidimicrobiales bacterium]
GGLLWWGVAAVQGTTEDLREVAGFPLPAVLAIGGLVLGLLLWLVARMLVGRVARGRADAAEDRLRSVVQRVLDSDVVQPVQAELTAYAELRRGITTARA